MSYDNLSSVSQNVLKFYQQHTGEERRISFIFNNFHFCRSRVIGLVFCVMFCRSLFVLFLMVIVASPSIYGFWLPLCYLLITPLLSSDYPFGIFWLPLCYLLITPLSSDYPLVSSNLSYLKTANEIHKPNQDIL